MVGSVTQHGNYPFCERTEFFRQSDMLEGDGLASLGPSFDCEHREP